MKTAAGKSSVFSAININSGQRVSVTIPTTAAVTTTTNKTLNTNPTPALTKKVISISDVMKDSRLLTKTVASPKVSNPTTIVPPSSQPPSSPFSLTLSPQVANQYAKMIDSSKFQIIKVGQDKMQPMTVKNQLLQNKPLQPTQLGTPITLKTTPSTNMTQQPQTFVLSGLPTTKNVPSTSINSSAPTQPIVLTITPSVATTTVSASVTSTPSTQTSCSTTTTTSQPIQFLVNPANLPQNITITLPTSSLIKSDQSKLPQKVMIPIQSIVAAQNANSTAKISAVVPVQRTTNSTKDQQTYLKMLTPPTTPDLNLKQTPLVTKTFTPTTVKASDLPSMCVSKQIIVSAPSSVIANKNLSTHYAKAQPVPVSISAVQSNIPVQVGGQTTTTTPSSNISGNGESVGISDKTAYAQTSLTSNNTESTNVRNEIETSFQPDVVQNEETPMFQIGSVYTLSENSAKELFPETEKVAETVHVKTEPPSFYPGEDSNINTAVSLPEEPKVRIKTEPPDTGYEKALLGTNIKVVEKASTQSSTPLSITKTTSEIVNKCAQTIAQEELSVPTSSQVLPTSLEPPSTSSDIHTSPNQSKKYVIVNKNTTPVIPASARAITIQNTSPPASMLLTPTSSESKPGEPMKWTVVAPPEPKPATVVSATTKPSLSAERTIVVHPPGTAMKATKRGVSTYIVKNPTGKTTVLQIKSAAAKLSEMAQVASTDSVQHKVILKGSTQVQGGFVKLCPPMSSVKDTVAKATERTLQTVNVKKEKEESPRNLPNMTPVVQVQKINDKLLMTLTTTDTNKTTTTETTTSPITSTTTSLGTTTTSLETTTTSLGTTTTSLGTTTTSLGTTTTSLGTTTTSLGTTSTSKSKPTLHTNKMMTRKRKQDLSELIKSDEALGESESRPTNDKAKKESVQDERIRKLKELLKKKEAALEMVRKKIKLNPSLDSDDE
ncbi:uncharacterized protein LOC144452802 isoform X2 [Glandiceps talaboti]